MLPARKSGSTMIATSVLALVRTPADAGGSHRPGDLQRGDPAVGVMGDHLGEQRVVVGRHLAAGPEPGVDADVAGDLELGHRAGRRQPARRRVFGDQPHLDGVAGERDVVLRERQGWPLGDTDLHLDQVDTR